MATKPNRPREACAPKQVMMDEAPPRASRFERAFCSLVAYERPRRLLELLDEQKEILTCDCERFFQLSSIHFTTKHPHFRQAARCAEILTGEASDDIDQVYVAGDEDGEIEVSIALLGSRKWTSTVAVKAERFAGAWLEARGDD
jgi:hypothetical protein